MPTNDQDVRALVYLASRLRNETHGCREWDAHGTAAVFARELTGKNLRIAVEEVLAHACDPEAKTPAAITRPFKPEPVPVVSPNPTAETACRNCGQIAGQCHPSCPETTTARRTPIRGDDVAAAKARALAEVKPMKTWTKTDPAALKPIPEGEADAIGDC